MSTHKKLISELPDGRYCVISWDIDTTGRRLIDNICQLAACTSNAAFSEYIMPHLDLNPYSENYHQLAVVTTKRCRMLKDLKSNKLVKTKSEISALTHFIEWLEAHRGATDGVILVCHEVRRVAPALLLEALRHYQLTERFATVVKGFANSYDVAKLRYAGTLKSVSLRALATLLLNSDADLASAVQRAALCYQIVRETHSTVHFKDYTKTIAAEEKQLSCFKLLLVRQNTFRPIFKHFFKFNRKNRQYASHLRKKLVENDLDYEQVKSAFETGGRKSIEEILKKISTLRKVECEQLLEILDCHFDPAKNPVKPKVWPKQKNHKLNFSEKDNASTPK